MNPTLRRVITAGLGSLALTDKAVSRLIDDLVSKGDLTRSEGERMLVDLERSWGEESRRLGEKMQKVGQSLERAVTNALSKGIDRVGLARRTEIEELKQRIDAQDRKTGPAKSAPRKKKTTPRRKSQSA